MFDREQQPIKSRLIFIAPTVWCINKFGSVERVFIFKLTRLNKILEL